MEALHIVSGAKKKTSHDLLKKKKLIGQICLYEEPFNRLLFCTN